MKQAEKKADRSGIELSIPLMAGKSAPAAAGFFLDTVLVLLGVFGAAGCTVTAFGLPLLPMEAILSALFLSILLCGFFHIRRARFVYLFLLVLLVSAMVYLYRFAVTQGFLITVNQIISTYAKNSGFSIAGYEVSAGAAQYPLFCTIFLLCAVFFLAYFLSWAIVAQRSLLLTLAATFPFLLGSLLFGITPHFYAILLLAACWGTMLFMRLPVGDKAVFEKKHGSYHAKNNAAAAKSGLLAFPALLLCFALILALFPRQSYRRMEGADTLRDNLVEQFSKSPLLNSGSMAGNSSHVNLSGSGSIRFSGQTMLQVKMTEEHPVYLKGLTGSVYNGFSWDELPESAYTNVNQKLGAISVLNFSYELSARIGFPDTLRPNPFGVFVKNVNANKQCIYMPYNLMTVPKDISGVQYVNDASIRAGSIFGIQEYSLYAYHLAGQDISYDPSGIYQFASVGTTPAGSRNTRNAYLNSQKTFSSLNSNNIGNYYKSTVPSSLLNALDANKKEYIRAEQDYRQFLYTPYTQLPSGIRTKVTELLKKQGMNKSYSSVEQMTAAVTGYLAKTCSYTLTPGNTPQGRDFTDYFLFENHKGYCVHFATAAVVMLRAMGVPARYAEGFIVTNEDYDKAVGGWADVRDNRAHAWVEIYQPGFGWQPVEATPGFIASHNTIQDRNPQDYEGVTNSSGAPVSSKEVSSAPSQSEAVSKTPASLPSSPQSAASSKNPQEPGKPNGSSPLATVALLLFALLILLILYAVWRQKAQSEKRAKLFQHADTNRSVIGIYEYLQKLGRFGGTISEEAADLALKARFSQHRITEQERAQLAEYAQRSAVELYKSLSKRKQLFFKYYYHLI